MKPQFIHFRFEKHGEISSPQEEETISIFNKMGLVLENEWELKLSLDISVAIMSDVAFREGSTPKDPNSWKYCFLLRDQPDNKVYINVDLFDVLPNEAEIMIKHETAHIVIGQLVNDPAKYRMSHFLEEGTAGLDNATDRLISKMKKEGIRELPDPLTLMTIQDIKNLGGDTNKDPFIDQLGYLILFSFVDFLIQKNGREKIIEVYKTLNKDTTLISTYEIVCKESLLDVINEWNISIWQLAEK